MKKKMTLTILLLCLHNLFAQTIRDTVFNNVILIKNSDVSTNGIHFLIDIPVNPKNESIVIFNDDYRIPAKLFFNRNSFLNGQNELFLITSDLEYYNNIRKTESKTGYHIKPFRQNKIYHIKRNSSEYKVDSLSIRMDNPSKPIKINFQKPILQENEVKYFFKECYGSTCCPKDINWDFQQDRNEIRKKFNEKYNVNIYKNTYKQIEGKEGEHCIYYTLSDLTNEQKIDFIFQPTSKNYFNPEIIDVEKGFSIIILPSVINIERMKHVNP